MFNFFLGVAVAVIFIGGVIGFVIVAFGLSVHSGRIDTLDKASNKLTDYWKHTDNHDKQIKELIDNNTHLWEVVNTNRNRVAKLEKTMEETPCE